MGVSVLWLTPLNTNYFILLNAATQHILFKLIKMDSLCSNVTQFQYTEKFAVSRHAGVYFIVSLAPWQIAGPLRRLKQSSNHCRYHSSKYTKEHLQCTIELSFKSSKLVSYLFSSCNPRPVPNMYRQVSEFFQYKCPTIKKNVIPTITKKENNGKIIYFKG